MTFAYACAHHFKGKKTSIQKFGISPFKKVLSLFKCDGAIDLSMKFVLFCDAIRLHCPSSIKTRIFFNRTLNNGLNNEQHLEVKGQLETFFYVFQILNTPSEFNISFTKLKHLDHFCTKTFSLVCPCLFLVLHVRHFMGFKHVLSLG